MKILIKLDYKKLGQSQMKYIESRWLEWYYQNPIPVTYYDFYYDSEGLRHDISAIEFIIILHEKFAVRVNIEGIKITLKFSDIKNEFELCVGDKNISVSNYDNIRVFDFDNKEELYIWTHKLMRCLKEDVM